MKLLPLFKKETSELFFVLKDTLQAYFPRVEIGPGKTFLYAKGESPILLVAHIDTVFPHPPKRVYLSHGVLWSRNGLGADDRAGIFGILKILEWGFRPHVLFTNYEEFGGLGARVAAKFLPVPNVHLVLGLDRRGRNQACVYSCDSPELNAFLRLHGFEIVRGIFSDIAILCPIWEIAGANLSVGFYRNHSPFEYFKLSDLFATLHKVRKILLAPPNAVIPYRKREPKFDDSYLLKTFRSENWDSIYF